MVFFLNDKGDVITSSVGANKVQDIQNRGKK